MRAEKFVHEHLDYLDGQIKLASCQKDILNVTNEQQNQVTFNYSTSSAEIRTDDSINDCSYSSQNVIQNINITKDIDKNTTIETIYN